jgi:hypothetical protein
MEMRQAAPLYFGHFQVVQLSDGTEIRLPDPALRGQQPADELDGVVPQP